jgi:hypothetical protein
MDGFLHTQAKRAYAYFGPESISGKIGGDLIWRGQGTWAAEDGAHGAPLQNAGWCVHPCPFVSIRVRCSVVLDAQVVTNDEKTVFFAPFPSFTIFPPPRTILHFKELREFKHGGWSKAVQPPSKEKIISWLGSAALRAAAGSPSTKRSDQPVAQLDIWICCGLKTRAPGQSRMRSFPPAFSLPQFLLFCFPNKK